MKIAVLSDIHGNSYAFDEVLESIKKEKVSKILILGDLVGYYYYPDRILKKLDNWDYVFIKGNHEVLLEKLVSGNIDEESLRLKYGSSLSMAIKNLSGFQVEMLTMAPDKKSIEIDGINILMCHGSPWDRDSYLYPDTSKELLDKCDQPGYDFVFIGHSHYSFIYRNINSTLINAGSVGQSRSKGGVASWFIINTENSCFEAKATSYDVNPLLADINRIDPDISYLKEILLRK